MRSGTYKNQLTMEAFDEILYIAFQWVMRIVVTAVVVGVATALIVVLNELIKDVVGGHQNEDLDDY
jgi:hypothetical protein